MKSKEKRLLILLLILGIAYSYPVLSLLQTPNYVEHIPLKLILVFGLWFVAIVFSAFIINRK
jgi:hypothetical protein